MQSRSLILRPLALALVAALIPAVGVASSHREAPFVANLPQVDASDFYMFTSYEPDRSDYVTFLANYNPLQDPADGPNFRFMDQNAAYDINVDNNGDAKADIVFRFQFNNDYKNQTVVAGNDNTPIPLIEKGPISGGNPVNLNRNESYTVTIYGGDPGSTTGKPVRGTAGNIRFMKPVDNIGNKSITGYNAYANQYIYTVNIPGCAETGRVFVGQRKDGFVVNLGELFDLVNLNPAGPRNGAPNTLHNKNVTTLALEVPKSCLLAKGGADPVIGGWTTASMPTNQMLNAMPKGENDVSKGSGGFTQVSRLGAPLVNEVVIGLPDKDRFNGSKPADDAQFLHYVTHPSLPVILHNLFDNAAHVPHMPRNDLVTVFLTGVPGLNQPANLIAPGEELRLNTSIKPTPPSKQNDLGVLGGDLAGFPNGRRPYDDVVDIELRAAEGALCSGEIGTCGDQTSDPNHGTAYTDEARSPGPTQVTEVVTGKEYQGDTYLGFFPYLEVPIPGSPNGKNGLPADGSAGSTSATSGSAGRSQ